MSNSNVVKLVQPGTFSDQLTEVLRRGARSLLAQAVEAEVSDFLGAHVDLNPHSPDDALIFAMLTPIQI